ncbi:hypothetical protein TNCV_781071 [Trichonephila clavipes]|nr:hypothetical protein TNCV_781071 [Trichonephila clavipes]
MDSWLACHEFKPYAAEDSACSGGRCALILSRLKHLPLVIPRHLTLVQNYEELCDIVGLLEGELNAVNYPTTGTVCGEHCLIRTIVANFFFERWETMPDLHDNADQNFSREAQIT